MKTTKTFEIEIERHNVTPAQFLAYLRSMQKKHPEMGSDFDLNMFSREGWSFDYSNALPTERPCESERGTDKPYQKQTYIRNFDGTTYNEIIEFDFDDEKTGHGYYYTVQIDVTEEDREANTAENVAAIIRRRAEQADRQEVKADKAEQEANEAERRGYTAQWWIDSKRTEAATLRREAAETRAAIKATQEAQEAPTTAPAAEAEQQPTETETAPQAATQAAKGTDEKKGDKTMTTTEREALERINARQNAANLFTNIGPADIAAELAAMEAEQAASAADPDATTKPAPVGVWMDDGSATDSQTAREMIQQNLEYLTDDDPARAEQLELLKELDRQEGRPAQQTTTTDEQKEEDNTMSTTAFTPAEAAIHAATVAGIIRRKGGYRERDLLSRPHTIERGTWNTEHKVVEILEATPDPDGYRAGCAVDIVTRSIVG